MLKKSSYNKLINSISNHYETAREALVRAYWDIGREIVADILKNKSRADYGAQLVSKLSIDLTAKYGAGFSVNSLNKMRRFFLTYENCAAPHKLNWSSYVELIKVGDSSVRRELESIIEEKDLSTAEVVNLVQKVTHSEKKIKHSAPKAKSAPTLRMNRGELYLYRIFHDKKVALPKDECYVDCGFKIIHRLHSKGTYSNDMLVRSVANKNGFSLQKNKGDHRALYTYSAKVERVVDGDTLKLLIDVGFGISVREKVRLKSIDTPEMSTKAGKEAKRFVESVLEECSCIVVKTYGYGKYARVMADVFYLEGESNPLIIAKKGNLLNQVLLEEGHARVY